MKKILFSSRYDLNKAVMERRKTMTRRFIKGEFENIKAYNVNSCWHFIADTRDGDSIKLKPAYKIGEMVAIAQPYKEICLTDPIFFEGMRKEAGWSNKMFVAAKYMPNRIRITDIRLEHLQDISDEDCLREGVERWLDGYIVSGLMERSGKNNRVFDTPREAFAALIDRINGRGTWLGNSWVVVYTFDLQRADDSKMV